MADKRGVQADFAVSNTPEILSSTTALEANEQRGAFTIQNLGTNPLFVKFGTGASSSVFNIVLKAGTGNDDGTGGTLSMEGSTMWTGIISVAGTSPRYTVTELTA